MIEAAFWGAFSASSLLLGAWIASRFVLPTRLVGLVMGFGAGALISAVSFDLIADAIDTGSGTGALASGIATGALTFFIGDWYIDRRGGANRKEIGEDREDGNASAILLGTVLDGIPESIVVGASLITGSVSAAMVAAAFISNLPEALGATTGLATAKTSTTRIFAMWIGIVALSGASAAFGYQVLQDAAPSVGAFFQAFAAGAILTMLADTMMPEAFDEGGKLVGLCTVLGFAVAV
ncbi:MAG: ZIP family metal transporter [Thermomicrobiales bacterium]